MKKRINIIITKIFLILVLCSGAIYAYFNAYLTPDLKNRQPQKHQDFNGELKKNKNVQPSFTLASASINNNFYNHNAKMAISPNTFTINRVYPKIFSPNNDVRNDHVEIQFDNPMDANPIGKIFDVNGILVAEMDKGANINTLVWNGRTVFGNYADPGAYIYQVEVTGPESKVFNGVIIVAR